MSTTARPLEVPAGPLVDAAWLERNLGHPRVRVLDVRGRHAGSSLPHAKRSEYEREHVPGAAFVDWEHDFVDAADAVPFQVAPAAQFARRAGELGIGDGDLVVTYDDYYGIFAARVAWAFELYGAEARVLDGGWQTWVETGRPTSAEPPERDPAAFTARERPLRLTLAEFEDARASGAAVVDARPRHLYVGEPGAAASGHIPAALCLPYQELVDGATGLFQSPAAVARLVRAAGIDPAAPPPRVVASCGSGISATVARIALKLVGVDGVPVYDGSFNEWSSDPGRPVTYGAAA